jgi:hypothetical protein
MRTFKFLTVAVASALVLSSCEDLDKLGDIDFGLPVEKTFAINQETATEPDGSSKFSFTDNIVLADYEEFVEYQDVLKRVSVKKVTATISNYVGGPAVDFEGVLEINGGAFKLNLPSVVLDNEVVVTLVDVDDALEKLGNVLTSSKEVEYDANLSVSEVPVAFDLKLAFDIEVKASAK